MKPSLSFCSAWMKTPVRRTVAPSPMSPAIPAAPVMGIRYYPFILLRYGERGRFASLRTTHGLDVCLMGKERVERDGPLAVGKPVA